MAMALRSLCRQGRHFRAISGLQSYRILPVPALKKIAFISTSQKDKNVGAALEPMEREVIEQTDEFKRLTERFKNTDPMDEENYTHYGYEPGDRDTDWFWHHFYMWFIICFCFAGGSFMLAYSPDVKFQDWCQREAFLELERRSREGLPLVDPNYADPNTMELPSDEDIGDQEVYI